MERKPEEISFYSPGERLFLLYDFLLKNTNREYVVKPKQINDFLNDHGIFLDKCPFIVIFRAIIRPHAFRKNFPLGMRSKF